LFDNDISTFCFFFVFVVKENVLAAMRDHQKVKVPLKHVSGSLTSVVKTTSRSKHSQNLKIKAWLDKRRAWEEWLSATELQLSKLTRSQRRQLLNAEELVSLQPPPFPHQPKTSAIEVFSPLRICPLMTSRLGIPPGSSSFDLTTGWDAFNDYDRTWVRLSPTLVFRNTASFGTPDVPCQLL